MLRLARLGAARRVCLQVLLRDVGQFAVGAQFVQGLVQVRRSPLFFRVAKPCSLFSPVVVAIFTEVSPVSAS